MKLKRETQGLSRTWARPEQDLSKTWARPEQDLSKAWAGPEQGLSKAWAGPEQDLSKAWAGPEQDLSKAWAGPEQPKMVATVICSCGSYRMNFSFLTFFFIPLCSFYTSHALLPHVLLLPSYTETFCTRSFLTAREVESFVSLSYATILDRSLASPPPSYGSTT
jgi:hypothetical protein